MRHFVILIIFTLITCKTKASPQAPDFLIIKNDTFAIYFLPLHHLDSTRQKVFFKNLQADSNAFFISTGLWRGYQAFWELVDNKLYLVGLRGNKSTEKIFRETFGDTFKNGKVYADWFSSYLAVGKDKMLKWDGIFSRTYFKEEIFDFKNGSLIERKMIDNYIPVKNGISRLDNNRKNITDTIFSLIKKLNWRKLSDQVCDDDYIIYINDKGNVDDIELIPYTNDKDTAQMEIEEHKKCIKKFKRQLKQLRFDIVKWNGKPFRERYFLKMFYRVEGELENWTY